METQALAQAASGTIAHKARLDEIEDLISKAHAGVLDEDTALARIARLAEQPGRQLYQKPLG